MFVIRNKKDLYLAYMFVRIFESPESKWDNPNEAKKALIDIKRAIREYTKPKDNNRKLIKSCIEWDYYIELVSLPDTIKSEEEACEYFIDYIKIPYYYKEYSPTGQWYTGRYKIFKRNGQYMVYHWVYKDV